MTAVEQDPGRVNVRLPDGGTAGAAEDSARADCDMTISDAAVTVYRIGRDQYAPMINQPGPRAAPLS